MKQDLLEQVSIYLLRSGYTVKSFTRACFDILARSGSKIFLIKTIEDANSLTHDTILSMKIICNYLNASPIIISEKAHHKLEDNVVYSRFGVSTLNFNSFRQAIENKFPFLQSTHAGITANINPAKFKYEREKHGYSVNSLANKIGVSRKTIENYETKKAQLTLRNAVKVYNALGKRIFERVNIFNEVNLPQQHLKSQSKSALQISEKYSSLGFRSVETQKVPFDVVAKLDQEIILTEIGDKKSAQLESISRLIDADRLVIFDKKKPKLKDIPMISKEEFLEFDKAKEIIKFVNLFK
jgi:putative transcriptional regulator